MASTSTMLRRLAGALSLAACMSTAEGKVADEEIVYLVANKWEPAHDYQGQAVSGRVDITTEGLKSKASQRMHYELSHIDDGCSQFAVRDKSHRECSIYISAGNPCEPPKVQPDEDEGSLTGTQTMGSRLLSSVASEEKVERFWNSSAVASDPWTASRYVWTKFGGGNKAEESTPSEVIATSRGLYEANTGYGELAPVGRHVVVHDLEGELMACAAIHRVQGCLKESDWMEQGLFDFSHAHLRCGFTTWCTKGHPECLDYCNEFAVCPEGLTCDSVTEKCRHNDLFDGAPVRDILAGVLFAVISGLAMSVGVGGGGFFVPLLMIVLKFENVHESTALSQACLAGGAMTAMVYNMQSRLPNGSGPLIDWDTLLITSPWLLLGSLIGQYLNKVTPDMGILVLLVVVLGYCLFTTVRKANSQWLKENQAMANPEAKAPERSAQQQQQLEMGARSDGAARDVALTGPRAVMTAQYPPFAIGLFVLTWVVVVASTFIRGSAKVPGLVKTNSPEYWVLTGLTALLLAALGCLGTANVGARSNDSKVGASQVMNLTLWSLGAGVVAALCGIGGGMVMGPILLKLGHSPQVQSATTCAMLLIMSTSTAIAFMVQGAAQMDYAIFLGSSTGVGALFGRFLILIIINRYKRPSLVMYLLAMLILVAISMMTVSSVLKLIPQFFPTEEGLEELAFAHSVGSAVN